jgi:hypothetical protein
METRPEAGPEVEKVQTIVRRRRTRRHRQNRLIRQFLSFAMLVACGIGASTLALRYLTPSLFHIARSNEPDRHSAEASRDAVIAAQQEVARSLANRAVYPYSVVPGGIKDGKELKWAAEHDPVVAAHYAGFDYDHARVVRLVLAQTAYVSYRIGNKIYWTRHRVSLKKGETVITDGKITARGRCANRVEEMPQQATSSSEPPAAKMDEPMAPAEGTTATTPPVPFQSALLNRNPMPGLGPAPPLTAYDPFNGGGGIPVSLAPLPGVCGTITKKKPTGKEIGEPRIETGKNGKKLTGGDPCSGGGSGEVPEPGTWLLMGTGLAFTYWMTRKRLARG